MSGWGRFLQGCVKLYPKFLKSGFGVLLLGKGYLDSFKQGITLKKRASNFSILRAGYEHPQRESILLVNGRLKTVFLFMCGYQLIMRREGL